jgi:DNA-directed RNA polymerase specialized sigma24 family protein
MNMDNFHSISSVPDSDPLDYDFGWLIQNTQISDADFCQILLKETSAEIERWVAHFFSSPAERIELVDNIVFSILLHRHDFKNNSSGKTWLYRLILRACFDHAGIKFFLRRKPADRILKTIDLHLPEGAHFNGFFETFTETERLIAFLHFGQALPEADITAILQVDSTLVRERLAHVQQALLAHQHTCPRCITLPMTLTAMQKSLREDFLTGDALLRAAREDLSDWSCALLERLRRENARKRTRQWAFKAAEIGLIAFLFLTGEWFFTRQLPFIGVFPVPTHKPGESVSALELIQQPSSTQDAPLPILTSIPDPKVQQILTFSLTSWARWNTLWADVQILQNNVQEYTDGAVSIPKQTTRKEIWLSLPGSSRVVSGPASGDPDLSYTILNGQLSGMDYTSGHALQYREPDLIPDMELQQLFSPLAMFNPGGKFTLVGEDTIAGRPAWILDWRSGGQVTFRYWIDESYGVILRRVEYNGGPFNPVISDVIVTRMFINASFPTAIYQPDIFRGDHFVYDFSGAPQIADIPAALQNWSPASYLFHAPLVAPGFHGNFRSSTLTFKEIPAGWTQSPQGTGLQLLADQHNLGPLPMGGGTILSCKRSPDGGSIAYNFHPQPGSEDTQLFIADLFAIQYAHPVLPVGITAGDFAFSPDNRKLAFFGCEKASGFCGVMVLDLTNQKITHLASYAYADYLAWSQDGNSIALLAEDDQSGLERRFNPFNRVEKNFWAPDHGWSYQVIDATKGEVTYRQYFDWSSLGELTGASMQNWISSIQKPSAGVQGCILPPTQKSGS